MFAMKLEPQKKNYYFFQTMINEIEKYDIVSFGIFDNIILRKVLFPGDIFKIIEKEVGISDFRYIRTNIEEEMRLHSKMNDVTIDDIYDEIKCRYPSWPIEDLKNREIGLELEMSLQNKFMKGLFEYAKKKKKTIFLVTDSCLSQEVIEKILKQCGYIEYNKLYISGIIGKSKRNGDLYKHIIDENCLEAKKWLHIGHDYEKDVVIPRGFKITCAFARCPREWFLINRQKEYEDMKHKSDVTVPIEPLDDTIEFSLSTANEINNNYTRMVEPQEEDIINIDKISMIFNMSSEKVDNIKEYIIRLLKRQLNFEEFLALKDVSFKVKKGEKIGLVGVNGSGKSTMLKIISGVMKPTCGNISVKGTIAPLIELGAGFDNELTARENIFLNGAILGYSHNEMKKCYKQIIEFSELSDFQDVAIKNYSSGMIARLGFAIATSHAPDILIIDEILSVGDFAFQKKCNEKMKELTQEGTTVILVSHSATDIIEMCDKAIWLENGNLIQEGEAQYIVEKYLNK